MSDPQVWDLYAIKYGTMAERTRATNLFGADQYKQRS